MSPYGRQPLATEVSVDATRDRLRLYATLAALKAVDGLTFKAIGKRFGVSNSTVTQKIYTLRHICFRSRLARDFVAASVGETVLDWLFDTADWRKFADRGEITLGQTLALQELLGHKTRTEILAAIPPCRRIDKPKRVAIPRCPHCDQRLPKRLR